MASRGNSNKIDGFFLGMVGLLTASGFVIFLSASLGLLAQNSASFGSIALKQAISLVLGIIAFYIFSKIDQVWIRRSALFVFIGSIAVNLLLFIPQFSIYHGGAARWLDLGPISFQPSELLKIAFIIYLAAWIYFVKDKIKTFKFGLLPYILIMIVLSILLLAQSDTDTLVIIGGTGIVMLFIAGVPFRHIITALLLMAIMIGGVIYMRPYALKRVQTFFNRSSDTQGAGYQINQSLIAIGSGQISGRGFGQSIQKFGYLPQPTDDSIFAVAAEEFGFIGSIGLILAYLLLASSIFRISIRASDSFGAFVAIGVGILIITESFLNMAAMLGMMPLSGVPLLFISHGGTALIIALAATGIVANVSKSTK
ncbi:MAG: putative peptidoglycan glycosyltransferase FtsW [Candidatus Taylorbacteria bacterium]